MPLAPPRTSNALVTLVRVSDKRISMRAQFGPTMPKVSGGYSGWKVVDRPQRRSMTEWQGSQPLRAQLQILLDGFTTARLGQSQNRTIAYLERHFAPTNGAIVTPPFRVLGAWPIPENVHWVIDDLTPDDDPNLVVVRRSDRVPIRALYTLSLLQYVPGDVIVKSTAAKRAKDKKGQAGRTRTYTVRKGDTLSGIASKQLGSAKRASEIRKLNPSVRDGKHLKVGLNLKLPA